MTLDPCVSIIDGDIICRKAVAERLAKRGLAAAGANSAEQFINTCDRRRPGCLLVDVQLPGMSGLQFLERLDNYNINLPVIIMADNADVPTAVRAMKAGAVEFLLKPLQDLPLWEAVQTAVALDARRRREQALRAEARARINRLTEEEQAVLYMLLDGKPSKIIAAALDVSPRTVDFRRASMLRKMEANSTLELARMVVAASPPDEIQLWTWTRHPAAAAPDQPRSNGQPVPRHLQSTSASARSP